MLFMKLGFLMISRIIAWKMQCLCKRRKKLISSSNRMHAGIACRVFSCSMRVVEQESTWGWLSLEQATYLLYIESIHDKILHMALASYSYKLVKSFLAVSCCKNIHFTNS